MEVTSLLSPDRIVCQAQVASKKRALELLSQLIAQAQGVATQGEVFESLLSRERLGSTGLGHGVAIPHGRLSSLSQALCAFVQLTKPIDFDALDAQPVDLLFALLVPKEATEEHLKLLAQLAEMLRDEELRGRLRSAVSPEELKAQLDGWAERHATPGL
jgi:PTS system nitrogen regulatory IIA component